MVAMANPQPKQRMIGPQPGPQTEFLRTPADICIYGGQAGGGKSYGLLLDQLRWCSTPGFSGIIFRRTRPQLLGGGGIWENANDLYREFGAKFRSGSPMDAKFPSGAKVAFSHLQLEKDKYEHQGQQYAVIGFDELPHFTETQFWYLVSRNRSGCGVQPYVRATCNPDAGSWVATFIAWWIDQKTGLAIQERSGVLRWMLRDKITNAIQWYGTEEDAAEAADADQTPLSVTFIPASLDDNPALENADPTYRRKLQAMTRVERERLLGGNWKISSVDGAEWPGDYFVDIDAEEWPEHFELSVIAVDASEGVVEGDYGAIVFAGLWHGRIYVDADIERRPIPELIEYTALMAIEHRPTEVTWEGNQFQKYLVGDYDRYVQDNHLFPVPTGYILNYGVKKTLRIKRLGGYLRKSQLKFRTNRPGVALLLQQLRGFPIADYDDGPDALEMAVRRLCELAAEMFDGTEYGNAGGEEYSTSYEAAEVYQ
jgi:predicted phage terminase large subunit-like protein